MANFAIMDGNIVFNTIIADDLATAEALTGQVCIEYTDENKAGIGHTYDGTSFTEPYNAIAVEGLSENN
jgi:hypothetical protein